MHRLLRRTSLAGLLALTSHLSPFAAAAPGVTAAKTAALQTDVNGNGVANPGDTLKYTIVITNSGTTDATGVLLSDALDPNTTLVPGSVHSTPLAINDTYTAIGNTKLYVGTTPPAGEPAVVLPASMGLLVNDFKATAPDTVQFVSSTAPLHGTVAVNPDGTFTYTPTAGYTGPDSFFYTTRNSADATLTDIASVNITVGTVVWYINNTLANGNGTSASPFNTLAPVNGPGGVGDVDAGGAFIYLYSGGPAYTGGIQLETSQKLTGNGTALIVDGVTLRAAGSNVSITNSGGAGVMLADSSVVTGVTISGSSGRGVTGTNIASATIDFNVGISGNAGGGVLLSGGGGNITVASTVATTANHSVSISGRTSGTVSFTAAVADTGTGILLSGNTGATINFSGGMNVSTGANPAFTATGGGTVSATQNNTSILNTLTTTTATALNVANTVIGAAGLTFRSISAGASSGSAAGLVLNTTGGGFFTVSGDSSNNRNGSGGTITARTGGADGADGVFVNSATNVSLSNMNITNCTGNGVLATAVNGIRMNAMTISGNADNTTRGDGFNEANVQLVNISGTAIGGSNPTSISNSTISQAFEHDVEIDQGFTGFPAVTLTDLQVNNCSITNDASRTDAGGTGQAATRVLIIVGSNGGTAGLTVQDSTLTGNRTPMHLTAAGIQGTVAAGTLSVKVYRNTLLNHNVAVDVSTSTSGVLNFDITDNGGTGGAANGGTSNGKISGTDSVAVSVFTNANATGSINGFIRGNSIGTQGVAGSGSVVGRGMQVQNEGSVNARVLISGNLVQEITGNQGINVQHGISVPGVAGTTNATITGNTVRQITGGSRPINVEILNTGTLNSKVTGNTLSTPGQGGGTSVLRLNRILPVSGGAPTHNNTSNGAAGLATDNTLLAGGTVTVAGTINFNQPDPALPTAFLMFSPGGVQFDGVRSARLPAAIDVCTGSSDGRREGVNVAVVPDDSLVRPIAQPEIDSAVAVARQRWKSTGLTDDQAAALHALSFEIADLPGWYLGEATRNHVRLGKSAGGNGWFIDASSASDALFGKSITGSSGTRSYTDPAGAPAGRIDLLTAVMHEMGHALGLPDTYSEKDRDSLMYGFLTVGERRLPAIGQAKGAIPGSITGCDYLFTPVNVGTLKANDSITFTFLVTVNTPFPDGVLGVSNQGSISGGNFATVLTNDPSTPAPSDATFTRVCATMPAAVSGGGAICAGASSSVTVMVSGGVRPYTVTLTNGGGTQTGTATQTVFTFPVTPAGTTTYTLAATSRDANNCPMTASGSALVTVNPVPAAAPTSPTATPAMICPGGPVLLSATVPAGQTVDWFTGSCGGTPVAGGATPTVNPLVPTTYFARARNSTTGCIGAACASVIVHICPADFNCSGDVSVQDIFDFLAAYFTNAPAADFNHSSSISVQDIFDFLAAYFAPCL